MALLHDDFAGSAGPLDGRIALTGQTWSDTNAACSLDGSGRYIRTAAQEGVAVGSYLAVAVAQTPTHLYADISFTGTSSQISENGAVVLIAGNASSRTGSPPTQGIYHQAIHAVFGCWQCAVNVWNDGAVSPNLLTYTYPGGCLALDGTAYRIGMWLDGQRIVFDMPDGTQKLAADSRVATYTGPYLIYQTYNDVAPNVRPRLEEVWADIVPFDRGTPKGKELPY